MRGTAGESSMSDEREKRVEEIMAEAGAFRCVECGKCVVECPMAKMYASFSFEISPRGVLKKALLGPDPMKDESIWFCTECNACTEICPEGVSCRDLTAGLRKLAVEVGMAEQGLFCHHCGKLFLPQQVMKYIEERLGHGQWQFLTLCPPCRRERYTWLNS